MSVATTGAAAAYRSDVEAVDALAQAYKNLTKEIGKVIVGQDEVVRAVIISLFSNGHSLLVGVPGLAKISRRFTAARHASMTANT